MMRDSMEDAVRGAGRGLLGETAMALVRASLPDARLTC